MKELYFRAIFEYKKRPYDEIWNVIDEALREYYPQESKGWSFWTKKVKREAIAKMFENSFGTAHTPSFSISIGSDGSRNYSHIMLTMFEHNTRFTDFIVRKISEFPEFFFGCVTDQEFAVWQNSSTPHSYILANKPHEHLPRLPGQVLGKDVINERLDLSANPGRRVFHMGYVEEIGGVMYVTEKLMELSGGDLDGLHALPFLNIDDWGSCFRLELDSALLANAEQDLELCSRMDSVRAVLFPPRKS